MKNNKFWICLDGKILESESLFEIMIEAPKEEWEKIVIHTIDMYINLASINKSSMRKMDKEEKKYIKMFKRSVDEIKKIDSHFYMDMRVEERIELYSKTVMDIEQGIVDEELAKINSKRNATNVSVTSI